jgi:hypothetical protein
VVTAGTKKPVASAFLSYATEDGEVAKVVERGLESQGISVFEFESDLAFGQPIWATLRRRIETSDYLLVLLSRSSLASDNVAREIGLALELQKRGPAPIIIGVTTRELAQMSIYPRKFEDGSPHTVAIDFAALRNFSEWGKPDGFRAFAAAVCQVRGRYERSI